MNPILKAHCESGHFSHGYLLIGDRDSSIISARKAAAILLDYDEGLLDSHPDFFEQFFDFFDMANGNDLKQKFSMRPILAERKVFLLGVESFNHEAITSLSQILEDSPETCYSFLISTFIGDVPQILRSRLVNIFEGEFKLGEEKRNFYEKFLKTGPVERLALIKNIASDKRAALEFLNELEIILSEKIKKEHQPGIFKNFLSSLNELQTSRRFLFDRAPSPKMITEHFALTLPRMAISRVNPASFQKNSDEDKL